jgi:hypothetical protein
MRLAAIIDIGSTSVGAALLDLSRLKKKPADPQVCAPVPFSVRHQVEFHEELNLERFMTGITGALEKAATDLLKSGHGAPAKIVCFFSAPFSASQTMIIKEERPEPFTVTEKWLKEKVGAEVKKLEAALGQKIYESKIMEIKLDGYQSERPFGQKAKLVEIANYVSLSTPAVEKTFRDNLIRLFHRSDVELHSFSFAFFNTIRDILGTHENMVLLDVGGEITEISLIWHGLLWTNVSYPQGRNRLFRQLTGALGLGAAETQSALKMYLEGTQHDQATEKLTAALAAPQTEWLGSFRQALDKLVENCLLPERIFIVGDPEFLPLFRRWLTETPFEGLITASKRFNVEPLREDLLAHFCETGTGVSRDLSLMIEAIFYDRLSK